MSLWWERCPLCGETFRNDQRYTAEAMLRAHRIEKHAESTDPVEPDADACSCGRWGSSPWVHPRWCRAYGPKPTEQERVMLPPTGTDYPQAHSDIQCFECLRYFRHEPDLSAHFEAHHPDQPNRRSES